LLISVLGPMEVRTDGEQPLDVGGAKQRAVLAQLAREPNVAVSVDRLAEGIWGTDVPPRYRQNLQVYVSTLRRVLEPNRPAKAPSRIAGHREAYELVAGPDEIDVSRFLAAVREGREALADGRPEAAAARLSEGLAEFRGAPLVDLADQPFAGDWVSELIEERTAALEDRIAADLARGRSADLVLELQVLVRDHPERERLWEQLMLALYRSGRQTEALSVFRLARERLLEEVGIDPGPDLARTADRILHQDPALMESAPATSESSPVPVPLTSVIGGDERMHEVIALVAGGERLVVLIGPGGVGKTRLCLAAAEQLAKAGRSAVWVPLEEVHSADGAAAAIAQRLGVTDLVTDRSRLTGRTDVLLLDNLEQIPDLSGMLQGLLESVPTLQVLATSRSPVSVRGEKILELQPLDPQTDAVELFAERARSIDPAFDLTSCRPAIVRICAALDGLPLAIELASARITLFTAEELADQLDIAPDPQDPSGSTSDRPAGRQGSLRELVGWSLALLPERTRTFFVHLAACPGSVDLDTAVAVGAGLGLTTSDARLATAHLVRAALVRSVEGRGGRRFTMLNTVRAVATAELGQRRDAVAAALAAHWVARARAIDPVAHPGPQLLASTSADLPATRWVLGFLIEQGRCDEAAEIVLANRRTLAVLGRADETLRAALALLDCDLSDVMRSRMSVVAGGAAYTCHQDKLATELLSAVATVGEEDFVYLLLGHTVSCVCNADIGNSDLAAFHATKALAYAQASGRSALQRLAHSAAGWAAIRREAFDDSAGHARAQLQLATDDESTILALLDIALAELFRESTEAATEAATESLRLAQRLGPSTILTQAQQKLGYALLQGGDAAGAAALLTTCLRGIRSDSDEGSSLETAAAIGLAAVILGRRDDGRQVIRRSNAFALDKFGVDCAVTEPLYTVASQHQVDISYDPDGPPTFGNLSDLLEQAIELGQAVVEHSSGEVPVGEIG
jgi:DNA-binding SARP family transcriptional activator/predicted ATPase